MCHLAVEGEEAIVEHLRGLGGPSEAKYVCWLDSNKLAKARKTRTSPNTLGLKKFGLGKLWVKKVFQGQKHFWKIHFRISNQLASLVALREKLKREDPNYFLTQKLF